MKRHRKPPLNEVRVTGGQLRGSRIPFRDEDGLRPTSGRVRETLFSWLAPFLEGSSCLDLFAGSGILSFEAISRGASAVTAIEKSARIADSIQDSAGRLDTSGLAIYCQEATGWIRQYSGEPFDIVFIDPPYDSELLQAVVKQLDGSALLKASSLVYLEHSRQAEPPRLPAGWLEKKRKQAGDVVFGLYQPDASA